VGNRYRGHSVGVRVVGDSVQITVDGRLLRTHRARHDKTKELGALGNLKGRPRRSRDVAELPEPIWDTGGGASQMSTNGVGLRHGCPTPDPAPVSQSSARLRFLGDGGSGTCVPPRLGVTTLR